MPPGSHMQQPQQPAPPQHHAQQQQPGSLALIQEEVGERSGDSQTAEGGG